MALFLLGMPDLTETLPSVQGAWLGQLASREKQNEPIHFSARQAVMQFT